MATRLTADQLIAVFDKWGVRYRQHPGWRSHNRNAVGAAGPVHGILLHHTGDDAPDSADERVLWAGRADLPGPLCNWGMTDDGVAVLIGNGRANHAGLGSATVLNHVINEDYSGNLTAGQDTVDGNAALYGQETMYSGGHSMTTAAYHNTLLAFAAICDAHGWTAKSAIGHKEWTRRKPDPGHLDMASFRRDLQAVLDAGPKGGKPLPPKPEPKLIALDLAGKTISSMPSLANAKIMLDYSWARPPLNKATADRRVRGIARYLSTDKGKKITDTERAAIHRNKLWTVFVMEDGKTPVERQRRPLAGHAAGVADAKAADALADALGVPNHVALCHPVDSDLSFAQVRDYWDGIHSVARRPRMVYGGVTIVDGVVGSGLAQYGWQTTSWSGQAGRLRISRHANFLQLHGQWRPHAAEVAGISPSDIDVNLVLAGPSVPVWLPGQDKRTDPKPKPPKPDPKPEPKPQPEPATDGSFRIGVFNWQHTDRANDQWLENRQLADIWALCEIESAWQRAKIKLTRGWGIWPVLGAAGAVPFVYRKARFTPLSKVSFKAGTAEAGVSPQRYVNEVVWLDKKTGKTFTHDHGQAPHHYEDNGRLRVYHGEEAQKFARQPARARAWVTAMSTRALSAVGSWAGTGDWNDDYFAEARLPAEERVTWFPYTAIASLPKMVVAIPKGGTHISGRAIDWTVVRGLRVIGMKTVKPAPGSDPATTSDHYIVVTEVENEAEVPQ